MNRIAYVIGPLRNDSKDAREHNFLNADRVAKALWTNGIQTFCPHLNSGRFTGLCEEELFEEFNFSVMRLSCNLLVLIPGWEKSKGSRDELQEVLDEEYEILIIHSMDLCEMEVEEYAKSIRSE